ncbi:hypothetical protein HMPREF1624_00435 [Sporothrix schenckii ATCC 58251]|uniref:amidase n=1 Tax=Sporothrix schenckii (strain ATCC 58251 / de Perez 2211183) TaxID=1391915 RepID=U7Q4N3_SPOS1|nr:hypothetical protein HMPREF1624_00435 [Sporothrix schenckii ATCC 58251]
MARSWQERAAAKQQAARDKIPPEWRLSTSFLEKINASEHEPTDLFASDAIRQSGILSSREIDLTESYSAKALVDKLASGFVSAEDVTLAFSKRAAIAQQLDSYNIKGVQSTIGYVSFLDREPAAENSVVVDMLLKLGAVLYVKTNIPQTMMVADSDNNIFGRTLNPHRTSLTAGGSSGGEGALVALRGSLIGVATDIAGSIRIPALCCGIYGFRPTSGRVPYGGVTWHGLPGHPGILATAGPLTTSLEDTELFLTAVLDAEPWRYDSTTHAVPWQTTDVTSLPLRIGVLAEDPKWPLHPPVRRAIRDAADLLQSAGHTIVPLSQDPSTAAGTGLDLSLEYLSLDTSQTSIRYVNESGEPAINSLKVLGLDNPPTDKPPYSIQDLAALDLKRVQYGNSWRRLLSDLELDIVLAPSAQNTAVPHDTYGLFPYTVMWNLLDYPAAVIPFSQVSKILDPSPVAFEAPARGPAYDPEALDGMPCAVQIIAPRFHDEKCLAASKIIDSILHKRQ